MTGLPRGSRSCMLTYDHFEQSLCQIEVGCTLTVVDWCRVDEEGSG